METVKGIEDGTVLDTKQAALGTIGLFSTSYATDIKRRG